MKILYFIFACLLVCNNGFAKVELNQEQIKILIDTICKTHHLPGVQVAINDIETGNSWGFSSGYRHKEILDPLENNHLMQIGSITKSFISSLVLLLEADSENGSLGVTFNIDQTLGDWLPEYRLWKHVKIRNLLNMTSGIYNYTEDNSLFPEIANDSKRIWQNSELVALAYAKNPCLLFPVGTHYSYSNTNYILIGMILEKVTGLPLETLINERILKKYPDHFKYTTFAPKTYPQNEMQNMAHGYAMSQEEQPEFYGQDITAIGLSWAGAAGAVTSTASDLANWPALLFSDDFLPQKQRRELADLVCVDDHCKHPHPLPKDSKLMGYGLGIARMYDPDNGYIWTHTGGTLGYHTLFLYLPEKSLVMTVIVTQRGPHIEDENDVTFIAQQVFGHINIQ